MVGLAVESVEQVVPLGTQVVVVVMIPDPPHQVQIALVVDQASDLQLQPLPHLLLQKEKTQRAGRSAQD